MGVSVDKKGGQWMDSIESVAVEKKAAVKKGYSITTYRFRLYRKHPEWFVSTKEMYCKVADFYLRLILDREFIHMSDYELQRRVEVLTQGDKKRGICAECPMPYGKVPLYFRRAALREAAAAVKGYISRSSRQPEGLQAASVPRGLDTSPVYYKGMYRNLDLIENKIELKLYNGTEWKWSVYRFTMDGREIPEGAELMSPTIKIEEKQIFLHFPVKQTVEDVRTVKERAGERYLAVSLQLGDVFAACVAETPSIEEVSLVENRRICMVHGGKKFCHRRNLLEERLKQLIRETEVIDGAAAREEQQREKLRRLIKQQAHQVSREIVDFASKEGCKVIAVPDYQGNPDFDRKPYLSSSTYDWIGRRIIEYTAYKSFQKGIVLCRIPVKGISENCSRCGARIKRYNEGHAPGEGYLGGRIYICPNGHRGNTALNTAENVGIRYREMYQKEK